MSLAKPSVESKRLQLRCLWLDEQTQFPTSEYVGQLQAQRQQVLSECQPCDDHKTPSMLCWTHQQKAADS